MTAYQLAWTRARDRLAAALAAAGFPAELSDVLAKQLRSPKAIDRMTAYVRHGCARSMEMLADEMLALCADAEKWREKKENQEAQAKYYAYLSHRRMKNEDTMED